MGLVRSGEAVHPVFGLVDGLNRTSLFTRRITFGTTLATASSSPGM
jgi:hypothetical protein